MNNTQSLDLKFPNKELPQKGERVLTVVLKEMIYQGNDHDSGSDWTDDGEGFRSIMFWMPLANLNEIITQQPEK